MRTLLGRMKRVAQQPILRSGSTDAALTNGVTRASNSTVIDQQGNIVEVAPNTLRRTNSTYVTTNYYRNPRFLGGTPGVIGSGGVVPSFISSFSSGGLSYELVGTGIDTSGRPYMDWRWFGVTNGTFSVLVFDNVALTTAPGDQWTGSVWMSLVRGSLANVTDLAMGIRQNGGSNTVTSQSALPLSTTPTQVVVSATMGTGATTFYPSFSLNFLLGASIDITVRIAGVQYERGLVANALALPSAGTTGTSTLYTGNRILVELAANNLTRNPRAEGATTQTVAVSTSTPVATNWRPINRNAGLQIDVTPITAQSMTGLRLRYYGTSTGVANETLEFELRNTAAVSAGVNVVASVWCRLVNGSLPPNFGIRVATFDNVSATVDTPYTQFTPDAVLRRYVTPVLVCGTNAVFVEHGIHMANMPIGTYDFTIDVFYPQIDSNGFASSNILPVAGTPAVTTRAGEGIIVPLGSWFYSKAVYKNLLAYSNFVSAQTTASGGVLTNGAIASPNGNNDASSFITTATTGLHSVQNSNLINFIAGRTYTASFYAKQLGTYRYIHTRFPLAAGFPANDRAAIFDVQAGVVAAGDPTVNARMVALPNGWYRCIMTQTATVTAGAGILVGINELFDGSTGQRSFTADGTSGVYLHGEQVVESALSGPYVDNPSTTLNSRSPANMGTICMRMMMPYRTFSGFCGIFQFDDQGFNNRFYVFLDSSASAGTNVFAQSASGGVYNGPYLVGTIPGFGVEFTVNVAFSTTGYRISVNGGAVVGVTTTLPTNLFTKFSPGSIDLFATGATAFGGEIAAIEYYPYFMTDAQLRTAGK